jgi:hypothetical protein
VLNNNDMTSFEDNFGSTSVGSEERRVRLSMHCIRTDYSAFSISEGKYYKMKLSRSRNYLADSSCTQGLWIEIRESNL